MNFNLLQRNTLKPFLEGIIPTFIKGGNARLAATGTNIWRDGILDNYAVTDAYETHPLELSNAILLKTREH